MSRKTAVAYVQQIEGEALETELGEIATEEKKKSVLDVNDLFPKDEGDSDKDTEEVENENKEE